MALRIPSLVLKQLYTFGSLQNNDHQVRFSVKTRLSDASLIGLQRVQIDGRGARLPVSALSICGSG
jgi:hydroxymethylglutaryl-CoA reductase (NADPH)